MKWYPFFYRISTKKYFFCQKEAISNHIILTPCKALLYREHHFHPVYSRRAEFLPLRRYMPQKTLDDFFLENRHYVKRIALRYVPFGHLAEEVVQQVYVELQQNAVKWDLEGNMKALLAVMTQNISRSLWRSEARNMPEKLCEIARHIRELSDTSGPEKHYDDHEIHVEALKHCLEKIPDKSREIIRLRYYVGLSFAQIAEMMGLKSDSVYRASYRLKSTLRSCIEYFIKEQDHV